jgi:hypothetical protein
MRMKNSLGMQRLVSLKVTDSAGAVDDAALIIEFVDNNPPEISVSVSPDTLWPPNHKMVPVVLEVDATDNCDSEPVCQITSVTSNEPINGTGDGNTAPDWEITGNFTVNLRAERSGKGGGREYTITVECTDASGAQPTLKRLLCRTIRARRRGFAPLLPA